MARKVMSWSKCKIEIGATGNNDAMSESLSDIGTIKDRSSELTSEDGEVLEMKATGGETVGYEKQEGTMTLTTRLIEPDDAIYSTLGIGSSSSGDLSVTTHVVGSEFSVKVTPKNVGSRGFMAPKTSVSVKAGWSEQDGHYLDLTFGILHGAANYWYKKFTVTAAGS